MLRGLEREAVDGGVYVISRSGGRIRDPGRPSGSGARAESADGPIAGPAGRHAGGRFVVDVPRGCSSPDSQGRECRSRPAMFAVHIVPRTALAVVPRPGLGGRRGSRVASGRG